MPCQAPATRTLSVLVYDSDRQNVVLFGGAGRQVYGDTWLWNGSCWQLANTTSSPTPRNTAGAAFDPARHVLVVYGGRTESDEWLNDTWTWDGTTWTQVVQTQHPVLRFAMGAFDPNSGKVVVYGLTSDYSTSQTWTWDGSWQEITSGPAPLPRASSALAYDPLSRRIILFGGRSPDLTFLGDTWAFDGISWKQLTPSVSPSARQNQVMATVLQGVVLFGGDSRGSSLADTWSWTGNAWQVQPTLHSPVGWGIAGMASRSGQALVLAYRSLDGPAQTYLFSQGDWSLT
jgi:hypothetical protein